MRPYDTFRFALHSIRKNKSRSIITTLIVFLIGFLVMSLYCISLSFSVNITNITEEELLNSEIEITHRNSNDISKSDLKKVKKILEEHRSVVTNFYSNGLYDFNYFTETRYKIIQGEKPNASIVNTNAVYLSINDAETYKIGDLYLYTYENTSYTFEVKGFYEYSSNTPLLDLTYYTEKIHSISSFTVEYEHQTDADVWKSVKELKKIQDGIERVLPAQQTIPVSSTYTYSDAVQSLTHTIILRTLVMTGAIFIGIILILLSIGSVSNELMISVDQKRTFFGLLKTEGLDNKNLFYMVIVECCLTMFVGIVLSFIFLFAMQPILSRITNSLIETVIRYAYGSTDLRFVFSLPIYVPVVSCVFMILFTLFFARKSLREYFKRNPIEIMQEEN